MCSRKISCSWDDHIVKIFVGYFLGHNHGLRQVKLCESIAHCGIIHYIYAIFLFLLFVICLIHIHWNYIFTNVTSYNLAKAIRCFGGMYSIHLQGKQSAWSRQQVQLHYGCLLILVFDLHNRRSENIKSEIMFCLKLQHIECANKFQALAFYTTIRKIRYIVILICNCLVCPYKCK